MNVAGIDYSTRAVDLVLIDEDTGAAQWHRWPLAGPDGFDRARDVTAAMPGPTAAIWDDVIACGLEEPRGYGAGSLYRVQGAVLSRLPRGLLVQPFIPSTWRKAVGLAGNAPKGAVENFVMRKLLFIGWPQDACDAYSLALATMRALERTAS